jgi:hypothetical protein
MQPVVAPVTSVLIERDYNSRRVSERAVLPRGVADNLAIGDMEFAGEFDLAVNLFSSMLRGTAHAS